ncbi:MAG: NAD-binding protein [Nannocystaceae bacterium]
MSSSWRRIFIVFAILPLALVAISLGYMSLMDEVEHNPRTFLESLGWAAETITSTGYGGDSKWKHPVLVVFVVAVQFLGLCLVFLVFPVAVMPFIEARFEGKLPRLIPPHDDFVFIFRHGASVESLMQDLHGQGVPVVVYEEDEAVARRLRDRNIDVVVGCFAEEDPDLKRLSRARAVIVNGSDEDNALVTLSAREQGYEGPIYALVDRPSHRRPMELVGATAAFTPKQILAAGLAAKASERIAPWIAGVQPFGEELDVEELRVHSDSALAGKTLRTANVRRETGATVVGLWRKGGFVYLPGPDVVLEAGCIVLAVGSRAAVDKLRAITRPIARTGSILVVGYGEVGSKLTDLLRDAGEEVRVIDRIDRPGVDVVGDALEPRVLIDAGVREAKSVILALDRGSPTLLAATLTRELAPNVPIIARVNRAHDVTRIYQTGVDFAMSVAQVTSQLLTPKLLGEAATVLDSDVRFTAVRPVGLVGDSPASAGIRERSGCAVMAVARGGQILVHFDRNFVFRVDDRVYICGPRAAISRFHEKFPGTKLTADAVRDSRVSAR